MVLASRNLYTHLCHCIWIRVLWMAPKEHTVQPEKKEGWGNKRPRAIFIKIVSALIFLCLKKSLPCQNASHLLCRNCICTKKFTFNLFDALFKLTTRYPDIIFLQSACIFHKSHSYIHNVIFLEGNSRKRLSFNFLTTYNRKTTHALLH